MNNYFPNSGSPLATIALVVIAGLLLLNGLWRRRNRRLSRPGMWVRIIDSISRRALAKKVASSPSVGVMQPPRLVRNPDNKTITVTMSCPEGSYDEAMAWFCPKAQVVDKVIGYMLKNDPGNGHVMFESIGTESDAFVRQLASVSNVTGYEDARGWFVVLGYPFMTLLMMTMRRCQKPSTKLL